MSSVCLNGAPRGGGAPGRCSRFSLDSALDTSPGRSDLQTRRRPAFLSATFVIVKILESDSPVPVRQYRA